MEFGMNICHVVFCADTVSYMIAKALSSAGHNIYIYFGVPGHEETSLNKIKQRLLRIQRVSVLSENSEIAQQTTFDRLIIQMFPRPQFMESFQEIHSLAKRTQHITLISAGDRSKYWRTAYKMQWKELRAFGKWINRIDRIVYKDGFHSFDLFMLIKSRRVLGFNVHSGFMDEKEKFDYVQKQNWALEAPRTYCINFIGSQDPDRRTRILDSIRPLFVESDKTSAPKQNIWHEFSDEKPNALEPFEFVDILSNSDFTLCPPGYSLITHRLIESLLRGSIPILNADELDIYDLDLKDGVNCIAVASENWQATIERCFSLRENDLIKIRRNIHSLVKNRILYSVSSREMLQRLSIIK